MTKIEQLISDYCLQNTRSGQLFQRAQNALPGGNTRTGVYIDPFPIYMRSGTGVYITDVDGNERLDFANNATALILGHAHPDIVRSIEEQVQNGTAFSAPTELEIMLAELLSERLPSIQRVRFCSSGTEAVLNALRAARAFTGRSHIAKFEGAYHGIDDPAMISYMPPVDASLGPEDRPYSVHSSAGLAPGTAESVIVLPFNDADACEVILRQNAADLAAVIIDPLSTAMGLVLPKREFLSRLRSVTRELGILLIFDEIVSFRLSIGGAQAAYDIEPDLTCLAKVIAGGTAGGAFGGRKDVMALYDPTQGSPAIAQSGPYNGNPMAMVAGLAALRAMTPNAYAQLDKLTAELVANLEQNFRSAGVEACIVVAGSLFRIYFLADPPTNYRQAAADSKEKHSWLYFWMANHGIMFRQWSAPSLPMTTQHAESLAEETRRALQEWPF